MAKIPDLEEEEAEAEVELSLGLSIGGSFRKNPAASIPPPECNGGGLNLLDLNQRRELQATRRHEVKKKKDENQQQEKNGFCSSNGIFINSHDRMTLEEQEFRCRVRDRMARENDTSSSELRNCKKSSGSVDGDPKIPSTPNPNPDPNPDSNFPLMLPMHYPYYPIQYMPLPNGFPYPYMMPCWGPTTAAASPVPAAMGEGMNPEWQSFRPYHAPDRNWPGSCQLETNGGKGSGDSRVLNRLSRSSSSAVSDNQSVGSMQGGGGNSSDTRCHSSSSPLDQTQSQVSHPCGAHRQLELTGSTHPKESTQAVRQATTDKKGPNTAQSDPAIHNSIAIPTDKLASNIAQSALSKPKEPILTTKLISTIGSVPPKTGTEVSEDEEKVKPFSSSLLHMPCVSTTGNGPNGKTITGLLYRYTKTEVSIVCVCHGSSFSPEGFVKHAGGNDISHPLRHITIVPSAF